MAEAVVTEPPHTALPPAQLAARYGLRLAGERPSLGDYTRRLWQYRHFISAFASGKNRATFTAARLGQLWHVLTPLSNAAVYYFIFGVVLKTSHGIPNFVAYLCAGIFIFGYTTSVVSAGVASISANLGMIRALQFPRAALPLAATVTQLQQLAAAMGVLMAIVVVTGEMPSLKWLLLLPVLLMLTIFNAGLAMAFARLGSKVTDLKQIVPFFLRTWLYGSGVFFALANVTKHLPDWLATVLYLNPMVAFIELGREALLEDTPSPGVPISQLWLTAIGWTILAGVGGYLYFWRGEKEYGRG